jgi:hypothetical protein
MKKKWILSLAAAPVLLGASPLLAQTLLPTATVTLGYVHDSNVARLDSGAAGLRGIQSSDNIFSPALLLNINRRIGRESVYLSGRAGYDFYDRNTILNSQRINLSGGGSASIGRCAVNANVNYARGQSNLDDLIASITKNIQTTPTYTLGFSCGRIVGFSPTFSITQQHQTNSAPILVSSNFKSLSETVGLAYDRPVLGTLTLYGAHSRTDYDNRNVVGGVGFVQDGFDTYGGGLRYQRKIGSRLSGTASVGYTSLKTDASALGNSSGLTYDASLDYTVSSRIGTHFNFSRAFQPTNRLDTTYSLATTYAASASYSLGSKWSLNGGVSSTNQQLNGVGLAGLGADTKETINAVTASANYGFSRRISFGLNARYEHRSANVAIYDYSDTQIGLSANASF